MANVPLRLVYVVQRVLVRTPTGLGACWRCLQRCCCCLNVFAAATDALLLASRRAHQVLQHRNWCRSYCDALTGSSLWGLCTLTSAWSRRSLAVVGMVCDAFAPLWFVGPTNVGSAQFYTRNGNKGTWSIKEVFGDATTDRVSAEQVGCTAAVRHRFLCLSHVSTATRLLLRSPGCSHCQDVTLGVRCGVTGV